MIVYLQMIDTPEKKTKFEQVYLEYRGLMFYVANSILHNEHDAEDMVHSAFVSIAENIKKIERPLCPKTKAYVVTVVESKSIDLYRRRQRHPEVPFEEDTVGLQVEYSGTHTLARCFARLPARYRHVLSLKYYHGFNNREIAKTLNISKANAVKLIQRAKNKLNLLCREEEIL